MGHGSLYLHVQQAMERRVAVDPCFLNKVAGGLQRTMTLGVLYLHMQQPLCPAGAFAIDRALCLALQQASTAPGTWLPHSWQCQTWHLLQGSLGTLLLPVICGAACSLSSRDHLQAFLSLEACLSSHTPQHLACRRPRWEAGGLPS